jgi:hypothetical protein
VWGHPIGEAPHLNPYFAALRQELK